MSEPRVVDLISVTPLSVHISIMLGKHFPFHFKMHDITLHIDSNPDSVLKANAGCIYLRWILDPMSCLCLDLCVYVLCAMFVNLDLYVGCLCHVFL